jgi:geranylgeranyl reductase family protein
MILPRSLPVQREKRFMPQTYDAIIVGGGPAGATAAFFLGEAGRKILVLEKGILPRYKTCGGAVSAGVLEQFPFSFDSVIESRVETISYALGNRVAAIPLADSSLCMVMRDEFDAYLLSHARAEVRQGQAVQKVHETAESVAVETAGGERFEGAYLIAADGANSILARALNLRRSKTMAGAIEVEASVPDETLRRFANRPLLIFGEIGVGYLWIFPKANHLSVGIGALNPGRGQLQSVLRRVMNRFGISIDDQPLSGHPLPIYSRRETIGTQRSLLAGDAAGLIDPFTGEGIRFAIKSGRLAAEAILSGKPERYTALVEKEIGRNHRFGAALTNVFYRYPRPSLELALRNPVLSYALMDMIADRIGYGRLLFKVIGSSPRFLLSKKAALEVIQLPSVASHV